MSTALTIFIILGSIAFGLPGLILMFRNEDKAYTKKEEFKRLNPDKLDKYGNYKVK